MLCWQLINKKIQDSISLNSEKIMLSYLILCSSRGAPALCTYQYSIEQLLKFGVAQEIISQTTHPVQSFTASH